MGKKARRGRDSHGQKRQRCPKTGRAIYPDRGSALLGLAGVSQMHGAVGRGRGHVEQCEACGGWHVRTGGGS